VIFWWKRGRLSWKQDVLPLIPFFLLGTAAGIFTAWLEQNLIGAEGSEYNYSVLERVLIAGWDIWLYLGKLFWPKDLIFVYPRWQVSQTLWWQYLYPAATLLSLAVLAWLRRRSRAPLAAGLFFIGTLSPAAGLFECISIPLFACSGPFPVPCERWGYRPRGNRNKSVLLEGGDIAAGSIPKLVRALLREIRQRSPDAGAQQSHPSAKSI
jgi:hypothetical protein